VSANTASSTARIADTAAGSIVRYPGHYAVRLTFLSHASSAVPRELEIEVPSTLRSGIEPEHS
jgi:hypothetical protein